MNLINLIINYDSWVLIHNLWITNMTLIRPHTKRDNRWFVRIRFMWIHVKIRYAKQLFLELIDCFPYGVNYTRPWPWRRSWKMKTFSEMKALLRKAINLTPIWWCSTSLRAPSSEYQFEPPPLLKTSAEPFLGLDKSNPSAFIDDLGCDLLISDKISI